MYNNNNLNSNENNNKYIYLVDTVPSDTATTSASRPSGTPGP